MMTTTPKAMELRFRSTPGVLYHLRVYDLPPTVTVTYDDTDVEAVYTKETLEFDIKHAPAWGLTESGLAILDRVTHVFEHYVPNSKEAIEKARKEYGYA